MNKESSVGFDGPTCLTNLELVGRLLKQTKQTKTITKTCHASLKKRERERDLLSFSKRSTMKLPGQGAFRPRIKCHAPCRIRRLPGLHKAMCGPTLSWVSSIPPVSSATTPGDKNHHHRFFRETIDAWKWLCIPYNRKEGGGRSRKWNPGKHASPLIFRERGDGVCPV